MIVDSIRATVVQATICAGALLAVPGWRPLCAATPEAQLHPLWIADEQQGVMVLDGTFVHNVGELWLNITNWGLIGAMPGLRAPFSDAPSATWPGGTGIDHLWGAGFWVGALKDGQPHVSTSFTGGSGQIETEFRPRPEDPLDTIYRMREGEPHGLRYPDSEDDDGDGNVDEDPRNGVDDDGDREIDEDYAAISSQQFRFAVRDNTPLIRELFPDHQPLDIEVVQESMQWETADLSGFVGFAFTITNIGDRPLQDVYFALYVDADVGPRDRAGTADDDLFEWTQLSDGLSAAYTWDCDGDEGRTASRFATAFLHHPTDSHGITAPATIGFHTLRWFAGSQPYDVGGDPTNDEQRYELLASRQLQPTFPVLDCSGSRDFRYLMAVGPFQSLRPGSSLRIHVAMAAGRPPGDALSAIAEAARVQRGAWFNKDALSTTGRRGRETRVCLDDLGPRLPSNPIYSMFLDCPPTEPDSPLQQPIRPEDLDSDGCVYVNADCQLERLRGATRCAEEGTPGIGAGELDQCTGVFAREFNVPWLAALPPQPPGLRVWPTHQRVHLFWDDRSELDIDPLLQVNDFQSYRVWRADGWSRPPGSSVASGPARDLWLRIAEFDVVDSFQTRRVLENGQTQVEWGPLGRNTGLDGIGYRPEVLREGSSLAQQFAPLSQLLDAILDQHPTLTRDDRIRFRQRNGTLSQLGIEFPQLGEWECCYDQLDTLHWAKSGVGFYEYVDRGVHDGIYYFYAVTATDIELVRISGRLTPVGPGVVGGPQSNFRLAVPQSEAQSAQQRQRLGHDIYVVPNPATRAALAEFSQLHPDANDPTGVRVEFRNLPRARNQVKIFTLSGDLVAALEHDGTGGSGSLAWNLVSRRGQEIVSGLYLYSVESEDAAFERVIGRFVVIR